MNGVPQVTSDSVASSHNQPERTISVDKRRAEELASEFFSAAKSDNTVSAYESDLRDFATYCEDRAYTWLPASPQTVATYIAELASWGMKSSTLQRRLVAISQIHKRAGLHSPTQDERVKETFKGIKRTMGSMQEGAAPILLGTLKMILRPLDNERSPAATRDRAILLLGLAGGFRRSELSSLRVEDIRFVEEGMIAILRRSKTDQEGEGHKVAIPYGEHLETCPVRNLKRWIELLKAEEGPLFCQIDRHGNLKAGGLTGQAITRMIKKRAQAAGLNPVPYSGHSLRAGFVTAASVGGAPDHKIMAQTDHRSLTTLFRYKRDADLFSNNAATYLGL